MSIIPAADIDVDLKLLIFKSVSELCYFDHGNDKETIDLWVEKANNQLLNSQNFIEIGDYDYNIRGLIGFKPYISEFHPAEITHLYIHPDFIKFYIGERLLNFAEEQLFQDPAAKLIQLYSSITARHFYLNHGYHELRAEKGVGRSWNFAMVKDKEVSYN